MTTPEDRTFSVWTYRNESEETDTSTGAPDWLLVDNLTEADARKAGTAIAEAFPGASIEIRDTIGDAITTYGPVRHGLTVAAVPRPASYVRPRRRLGKRGQA